MRQRKTNIPNFLTASPQLKFAIINNYSPDWGWLVVDIHRTTKRRGKYPPLATDTEVNSYFTIFETVREYNTKRLF